MWGSREETCTIFATFNVIARVGRYREGFATSGFNFNDRFYRGTNDIRACHWSWTYSMYGCMRHYVHSPPFEFIWRDSSVRFDGFPFTIGRHFWTIGSDPPLYISAVQSPSFLDIRFCVLFAYFVPRICWTEPFPACVHRHVYISVHRRARREESLHRHLRRCNFVVRISGGEEKRGIAFHLAFRLLIYNSAFARSVGTCISSSRETQS